MTLRVRALDANGDYRFGGGIGEFLIDSPEAVAQKIKTRMALWQGEFFLDSLAGTPWMQQILGRHASGPPLAPQQSVSMIYDVALKQVLSATRGVSQILSYSSSFDGNARTLTVSATVLTIFSTTPIQITQGVPITPQFTLGATPLG